MDSPVPRTPTLSDEAIDAIQSILLAWGAAHFKPFPWRTPAEPWHGLIAEILLQRTRAPNVIPVYAAFLQTFPTPGHLAVATVEAIEGVIYPLGLRWRAPLLQQLGAALVALDGAIPTELEALLALPGVGPYAAAAWLSFHGGGSSVLIDANIVRWLGRLVDMPVDGETRRKQWLIDLATRLTPPEDNRAYNYAALDFTMEICAKVPACARCPIGAAWCAYGRRVLADADDPPGPLAD